MTKAASPHPKPKPNGGRKHRNMTLAEERALLARFAKAAEAGEMLNIHDLETAYEKAIGHSTSDSTVYGKATARLAQADAAPVSSQARPRGTECF